MAFSSLRVRWPCEHLPRGGARKNNNLNEQMQIAVRVRVTELSGHARGGGS